MAISDLTQKIIKDGEKKSQEITLNTKERINKIAADTEIEVQKRRSTFEIAIKTSSEVNQKKVSSSAEQEAKMIVDRKKREILDKTFEESLKKLQTIKDKEYGEIITKLLKTIDVAGTGVIKTPKKRLDITKKCLSELNLTLNISETEDISGGFILVGDNFEYDFSFEKIISDKKKELEIDVANILFG